MSHPSDATASEVQRIQALLSRGLLPEADRRCGRLLAVSRDNPDILCLASEVALGLGKLEQGVQFLRTARAECREDVGTLINLGLRFIRLGYRSEALSIVSEVTRHEISRPELLDAIGSLLTHCDKPELALSFFERAVSGAPADPGFRYNLAMSQRMVGSLVEAESNLDVTISLRPDDGEAFLARSGLRIQTCEQNHVAELEAAVRRLHGKRASIPLQFALAKELEDLREDRRSFAALKHACDAVRSSLRYDVAEDVAVLEALRRMHVKSKLLEGVVGARGTECIFIIGLPRSGTTLVERILGRHSEVYGAGELDLFPAVAIRAVRRLTGTAVPKLEFVARSLEVDPAELGDDYLNAARSRVGQASKFTDKLPSNYLYAGLILRALPGARVLALRRDPMDVCYAMYKTLFGAAYPFTYSLEDIARYYVAWDELLKHWANTLGDVMLTVEYEALISDQRRVTEQMLRHCGLDWEDSCLTPHEHAGPVMTASAAQVRRPVYTSSVHHSRRFSDELEPIANYLRAHGISWAAG
jgi:tetratricopeptide (TPR) repeat protein